MLIEINSSFIVYAVECVFLLLLTLSFTWNNRRNALRQAVVQQVVGEEDLFAFFISVVNTCCFVCGLIAIVCHIFARNTYYDYFTTEIMVYSLGSFLLTSYFLSLLFDASKSDGDLAWRWFIRIGSLVGIFVGGFILIKLPMMFFTSLNALRVGPSQDSGTIEMLKSYRYDIAATIGGHGYMTPKFAEWPRLRTGEIISFVHDPARTAAFPPTQIGLTLLGSLVICLVAILWIWTIGFIVYQLTIEYKQRA
jgi:hypothetical protein